MTRRKIIVPEAREALDQMKMEMGMEIGTPDFDHVEQKKAHATGKKQNKKSKQK